jgi:hypothetical protein
MQTFWQPDGKFQLKYQIDQSCDFFYILGGRLKKKSLSIHPSETVVELGERIHDLNLVPINQGGCSLIFAYFARFPLSYEHHPEQAEDMIGFNEMKVIFFESQRGYFNLTVFLS